MAVALLALTSTTHASEARHAAGSGQMAGTGCVLSPDDQRWVDQSLSARRVMAREIGGSSLASPATVIVFDAQCVLIGTNAFSDKRVSWHAEPHAGKVRLPNEQTMPAGVTSFATEDKGAAFFVMSVPSIWRSKGVPGGPMGLEKLMTAVFLHESAHVSQFSTYMRRVTELTERNKLPDDFNDDSIQKRFGTDKAFSDSVAQETDLLFAAAVALDDAEARRLAGEARSLIAARRAQWFTGADAYLNDAEDQFLALEGSGQWLGYSWLTRKNGGGMTPADAVLAFGRRGGWWTQVEGLALILATGRIGGRAWRAHAFGDGTVAGIAMLDQALASPERGL